MAALSPTCSAARCRALNWDVNARSPRHCGRGGEGFPESSSVGKHPFHGRCPLASLSSKPLCLLCFGTSSRAKRLRTFHHDVVLLRLRGPCVGARPGWKGTCYIVNGASCWERASQPPTTAHSHLWAVGFPQGQRRKGQAHRPGSCAVAMPITAASPLPGLWPSLPVS